MAEQNAQTNGYGALAWIYDRLNAEIDYVKWADFVEACFDRYCEKKPALLLDLACGTGRMTTELAKRGYDMIGIDGSEEMLSEAYLRSEGEDILYLKQDMRTFELYGTVGGVTCCLDSMNYLVDDGDLVKAIRNVRLYLEPGGLFLFDMNTPYKFEPIYRDESYILEDELPPEEPLPGEDPLPPVPIYCGWQNHYDKDTRLCDFWLSIFLAWKEGQYQRYDEHQLERCYTHREIQTALEENGFRLIGTFAGYDFESPTEDTHRWYFVARAVLGNTDQQIVAPDTAKA
jgi:SAM-dependent methyltransferase